MNWAKIGLFAAGVLFGTAGIKVLGSKDAKKVYTETTAAALRAKECVMTTVTTIKENANDILTDAKEINEQRATDAAAEVIEDAACACTEETASAEESTEALSRVYPGSELPESRRKRLSFFVQLLCFSELPIYCCIEG